MKSIAWLTILLALGVLSVPAAPRPAGGSAKPTFVTFLSDDWMKTQGDQQTVFQEPRLLKHPASYAPVTNPPPATTPTTQPPRP